MLLIPNELLFGVAPEILVDCARQLHARNGQDFSLGYFCETLGAPLGEASIVLDEMVVAGFFAVDKSSADCYVPTTKLAQLALANISNGVSRAEAEELLQRVIDRADLINSDLQKSECRVTCIVVFGSYLTDKAILGDLDIGVEIQEIRRSDQSAPINIRKLMMGGATPWSRAVAALRLRKPKKISVHQLDEVLGLGTPYRVVFGAISEEHNEKH